MRRENRKREIISNSTSHKALVYTGIAVAIVAVIVFALLMYSNSLKEDVRNSTLDLEKMSNIVNSTNTESASTEIGKTVEEAENELNTTNSTTNSIANNTTNTTGGNATNSNTTNSNTTNSNSINSNTTGNSKNVNSNTKSTQKVNTNTTNNTNNVAVTTNSQAKTEETKKELSFERPVDGDIVREYAKDNLIYSDTLEEWTTHQGIDIKADKTTVVKSAEAGTVKSIKNDPRYGLTIVIEHDDTFQTIYSNLLTSEFVVEGEKVEKGQAIGTVGNTAVFEIVDEPHLHFEIWKNNLPEDPNVYIK